MNQLTPSLANRHLEEVFETFRRSRQIKSTNWLSNSASSHLIWIFDLVSDSCLVRSLQRKSWWFGTCFIFPFSWECHHPNWLSHIFFRWVGQPPTRLWLTIINHIIITIIINHQPVIVLVCFGHLLTLETTEGESRSGRLAVQGWEVFAVRCGGVRLLSEVWDLTNSTHWFQLIYFWCTKNAFKTYSHIYRTARYYKMDDDG